LLYVNTVKEGRVLAVGFDQRVRKGLFETATYNGLYEIARAAHQYVGETAKSVERREELVRGLHCHVSDIVKCETRAVY
jgi:hypothetical protein